MNRNPRDGSKKPKKQSAAALVKETDMPSGVYSVEADEEADPAAAPGPSEIARDLSNLKDTILRVASERERLPQPLFWSLFRSRLQGIKQAKEVERVLQEVLGGSE